MHRKRRAMGPAAALQSCAMKTYRQLARMQGRKAAQALIPAVTQHIMGNRMFLDKAQGAKLKDYAENLVSHQMLRSLHGALPDTDEGRKAHKGLQDGSFRHALQNGIESSVNIHHALT